MFFKPNIDKAVATALHDAELRLLDAEAAYERADAELRLLRARTARLRQKHYSAAAVAE